MSALALDIGTYSIKALAGKPGSKVVVERSSEVLNPLGLVIPTDDASKQKLTEYLNTFFTDHKLPRTDLRLSLPESAVSTKVISIPSLTDAELASAINWQAEQHIPIPLEELSLEYEVLHRPTRNDKEGKMRVLLIGVRKELVERYLQVFLDLGIEPSVLETQALSVLRSIQFSKEDGHSLLVHMGAASMDTVLINNDEVSFVFSTMNGGNLLTKALEQELGLEASQAEQYKRSYGLDEKQFQGKIAKALEPSVDLLVNEMQKAVQFFLQQNPTEKISRVLLSGGSALLPGLVEHVTKKLSLEVLLVAPFASSSGSIPDQGHLLYSVCMGLLMREK